MADNYDNTNSGLLFASDKKWLAENPKRPVIKGKVNVAGVEYELAIFKMEKKAKNGAAMLSAKFTPAEANGNAPAPAQPSDNTDAADDDMPF